MSVRQPEVGGKIVAGMNQVGLRDRFAQHPPYADPFGKIASASDTGKADEFDAVVGGSRRYSARTPSVKLRNCNPWSGNREPPNRVAQTLEIAQP